MLFKFPHKRKLFIFLFLLTVVYNTGIIGIYYLYPQGMILDNVSVHWHRPLLGHFLHPDPYQ